MNKRQLRHHLKQQRQRLSLAQRQSYARAICQHLQALDTFQHAKHLGLYLPLPEEVDVRPLFDLIWGNQAQQLYLPVMDPKQKTLSFQPVNRHTPLLPSTHGLLAPEPSNPTPPSHLDVLIVPLVGFDKYGHRLGMGAGYYDKTLASCATPPPCLGVGFACQQVTELPVDPWDYPLSGIVTENGPITLESTT